LYGVAEEEKQDEIEGRHLPDFALAAEPHTQQHDGVDGERPQKDIQQDWGGVLRQNNRPL
jgi:hypothetical protein